MPCVRTLRLLFIGLSISLFAAIGRAEPQSETAGYVTRIRGEVAAVTTAGRRTLALGHALYLGDRIVTGAEARFEARLQDGTVLTLGEYAEFMIQQVQGVAPNSDGSVFELLKGVFRAVTAQAIEERPQQWQVRTPVAVIGVRGTELWGGFNLLEAGSDTLDVVMLQGKGVYVENAGHRVELKRAGDSTTVKGVNAAPTPITAWGEKKLQAAQRTVAWE